MFQSSVDLVFWQGSREPSAGSTSSTEPAVGLGSQHSGTLTLFSLDFQMVSSLPAGAP